MVLMNDFFLSIVFSSSLCSLIYIYLNGGPDSSYWKFMFIYFYNKQKKMRILNATQSIQNLFLKESDVFEKCTIINFSCFHFTTQHILVALISTFTFLFIRDEKYSQICHQTNYGTSDRECERELREMMSVEKLLTTVRRSITLEIYFKFATEDVCRVDCCC